MWQPMTRFDRRRLVALIALVAVVATVSLTSVPTTTAQADLLTDELSIGNQTETVNGDVSGVTLQTSLDYQHDVPEADRRLINLYVAPEGGEYEQVTFDYDSNPTDQASGTVSLSGDITEHSGIDAADIDPVAAGNESMTVDVKAEIEVERTNGDPVVSSVTDTATLTVEDGTTLSAEVGGTGSFTVQT